MYQPSRCVYAVGLIVATAINLLLFAFIPHSSMESPPQPVAQQLQKVYLQRPSRQVEPEQRLAQNIARTPAVQEVPQPQVARPLAPVPAPAMAMPSLALAINMPSPQLKSAHMQATPHVAPDIFTPSDLDAQPSLSYQSPPLYPFQARRRGISGYVKLQFDVMPNGEVRRLRILESEPPGVFDQTVLDVAKTWKYQAGQILGERVRTRMVKQIVFNLEEGW